MEKYNSPEFRRFYAEFRTYLKREAGPGVDAEKSMEAVRRFVESAETEELARRYVELARDPAEGPEFPWVD